MSDTENYLDQLLHSVNGGGAAAPSGSNAKKAHIDTADDSEALLNAYAHDMGDSDDDFLASFEKEMGLGETDDFGDPFAEGEEPEKKKGRKPKKEKRPKKAKKAKKEMKPEGEEEFAPSLFDELESALNESRGNQQEDDNFEQELLRESNQSFESLENPTEEAKTEAEESPLEEVSESEGESEAPEPAVTEDFVPEDLPDHTPEEEALSDEVKPAEEPAETAEIPKTEDGEPDLAGMDGENLLDMLSETEGMEDIGDLLSKDENGDSVEQKDSIGEFAQKEMDGGGGVSASEAEAADEDGKKKKKEKGKGFFAKLLAKLLHDPEEDDDKVDISPVEGSGVEELSDENLALLRELEGTDGQPEGEKPPEDDKKKKDKKKKEKKEKPKKEPKPKKPPKPKKEKKPKEPDNSPKLNKKGVFVLFVMVGSMLLAVVLLNNVGNHTVAISSARNAYQKGEYIKAAMELEGITIKEKNEKETLLYNQVETMGSVYSQYSNFLVFNNADMQTEALDSLVCAAGRYDANLEAAEEYECTDQMNTLGLAIKAALSDNYGMTMDEAIEMYGAKNRKTYTALLHEKIDELGLDE